MNNVLLSASHKGTVLRNGTTVVRSKVYDRKGRDRREIVLRGLIDILPAARVICDHGTLSIETDNGYVFDRLSSNKKRITLYSDEILTVQKLIQECDALVTFTLSKTTRAEQYLKHCENEVGSVEEESVLSAFDDLD